MLRALENQLRLEDAPMFRASSQGLPRYIATCRTAKYRLFTFLPGNTIPDAEIVAIASSDAIHLGILSSSIHCLWALKTGAFLEDRPNYNHAGCFNKFPFPALEESALKQRIHDLGERLDAHRIRQQELHPAGIDAEDTGALSVSDDV